MELKLALFGGVIPACILGVVVLLGAGLSSRAVRQRPTKPSMPGDPSPGAAPIPPSPGTPLAMLGVLAWVAGFVLAVPFIHYASWSWPLRVTSLEWPWDFSQQRLWPVDATARLIHTGLMLAAWVLADIGLGRLAGASHAPPTRARRTLVATLRWIGRGVTIATVLTWLIHPYERSIGRTMLLLGVGVGTALVLLSTWTTALAQRERHPSLVWGAHFLAALGAVVVLIIGRTATAGQAAAGVAALAAATAVATLISRRAAPGPTAAFVIAGMLAWLLAVGCFATGKTNLASSILLMLAPIAWALPRRLVNIDLVWKRVPVGTMLATAWTLTCVAAAVATAVLTQNPVIPSGY